MERFLGAWDQTRRDNRQVDPEKESTRSTSQNTDLSSCSSILTEFEARIADEFLEAIEENTLEENLERSWSCLVDAFVNLIEAREQSKSVIEKMEAEAKRHKDLAEKAKEKAVIARQQARSAKLESGRLRAQVERLRKELEAARAEHERYVSEFEPLALEKAHADAVAEYFPGMKDLKYHLLKHNPSANPSRR
ncbi:hypothetical protein TIFTF001_020818 [Ficus carica]|uniref:Uncharacterized protein n=1 Tax=Ficus carica TaxID=3494 RepID=A0AA88DE14_FICCA|nr:hypothetical protein TIFTF001_020818 [Ficus carica]